MWWRPAAQTDLERRNTVTEAHNTHSCQPQARVRYLVSAADAIDAGDQGPLRESQANAPDLAMLAMKGGSCFLQNEVFRQRLPCSALSGLLLRSAVASHHLLERCQSLIPG